MDLIERHAGTRRHPWELARAKFVIDLLRAAGLPSAATRIVDIGSGDAWLAGQLRTQAGSRETLVCWDANYTEDDRRALAGERAGITFTAVKPRGPFDLLLLLDVLEHVPDDVEFLSSAVSDLAAPEAHVLVTVPAWQSLFSQRDTHLGHYRRYSIAAGRALVRDAGLRVLHDGGLFHSLLPMRAAAVMIERVRGARNGAGVNPVEWHGGNRLTKVLTGALAMETRLSLMLGRAGVPLPGLSYWALCRRPR